MLFDGQDKIIEDFCKFLRPQSHLYHTPYKRLIYSRVSKTLHFVLYTLQQEV